MSKDRRTSESLLLDLLSHKIRGYTRDVPRKLRGPEVVLVWLTRMIGMCILIWS